jgi:hydrogenase-4 component B
MSQSLLVLAPLLPLLLAPLMPLAVARRWHWILALAALPALLLALLAPVGSAVTLPWLLLGVHLELDAVGHLFLLFSSLIWLATGAYVAFGRAADAASGAFGVYFLLAMAGNLLLIVAADMLTFYTGFALMGLSAYGLVLRRSQRARRAGRVYLAFTLAGELALFGAMLLLFGAGGSLLFSNLATGPLPDGAVALLLLGFGIKVALPGLHPWLPLTYTAAPVAAVAVLSGPMMKAGLLGWLRFLPPGAPGADSWGPLLMVLGGLGILLGVAVGVLQRDPRAVLAYSSIAKMGLISVLFGAALSNPQHADALLAALLLFAMHHLLVKSTLFLGLGEWQRRGSRFWVLAGLALLALSMVAVPFSGGAAAKQAIKVALEGELGLLLTLSAIGTVLLMARFLVLLPGRPARSLDPAVVPGLAWFTLVVVAFWAPFWPTEVPAEFAGLGSLAVGAGLVLAAWWIGRSHLASMPYIPPGDAFRLLARLRLRLPELEWRGLPGPGLKSWLSMPDAVRRGEETALLGPGLYLFAVMSLLLGALWFPL